MPECDNCGKEAELLLKICGRKLCKQCAVEAQKEMDPDSLGYSVCI